MTSKHADSNVRKISDKQQAPRARESSTAGSVTLPCGYTYTQELITPERAADYLGVADNRKLRESHASTLARAMDADQFLLTPASVFFDTDGRLIQGQHTLRAIMLANRAVQLVVVRNVPKSVFPVLDCGLPRQMPERLHSDRVPTSICMTMFRLMVRGTKSQHYEIQLVMDSFAEALNAFRAAFTSQKRGFTIAHYAAVVLRIAADQKAENAEGILRVQRYLERIAEGDVANLPPVLRSFYRQFSEGTPLDLGIVKGTDQFCRAWLAFKSENENVGNLRVPDHREVLNEARAIFTDITCEIFS